MAAQDPRWERGYATALGALALLFFGRVAGQALVAFAGVAFLPSMEHWYSALLPYPVLLAMQAVILATQAVMITQIACDRGGWFTRRGKGAGRGLIVFSLVYAAAMAARYAVTMTLYPERRWLGPGTIPVAFHIVLAAYLWTYGRYLLRRARGGTAVSP